MEPPAKRPRLDVALFDDQEDIDGDELNLQPEQVNALRDPGYQLERSRAFNDFKLKSIFESIFEKYGKDFEGIGDEVNPHTGEIEVDNGHIRSLKDADLVNDDDDENDSDSEARDEERILQGNGDAMLLSRFKENYNSSLIGSSRAIQAPTISSIMDPQPGSLFTVAGGLDSWVEPAWRAPALPVRPPTTPLGPRMAKMKLLVGSKGHTERDDDDEGGDEDDILLGVGASTPVTKPSGDSAVKKKRLSLPAPPLGDISRTNGVLKSTPRHKHGQQQKAKGSAAKQKIMTKPPTENTLKKKPGPKPDPTSKRNPKGTKNNASQDGVSGGKQLVAVRAKAPNKTPTQENHGQDPSRQWVDADLYVNHSSPSKRLTIKPKNQTLAVEILLRQKVDSTLFRVISPEPTPEPETEPSRQEPPINHRVAGSDQTLVAEVEAIIPEKTRDTPEMMVIDKEPQPQKVVASEVFTRNVLDPSYMFSDEDEPTLPKARMLARKPRKKSGGRQRLVNEPVIAENAVVDTLGEGQDATELAEARQVPSSGLQVEDHEVSPSGSLTEDHDMLHSSLSVEDPETIPSELSAEDGQTSPSGLLAEDHDMLHSNPLVEDHETSPSKSLADDHDIRPSSPLAEDQDVPPSELSFEDPDVPPSRLIDEDTLVLPSGLHIDDFEVLPPNFLADGHELPPLEPLYSARRSPAPAQEASPEMSEPEYTEVYEDTTQLDFTFTEYVPGDPDEIDYSTRLLWKKPRRKRKIPVEFFEEPTPLPDVEESLQADADIAVRGPSPRKKQKQSHPEPDILQEEEMPQEEEMLQEEEIMVQEELNVPQEDDMPREEDMPQEELSVPREEESKVQEELDAPQEEEEMAEKDKAEHFDFEPVLYDEEPVGPSSPIALAERSEAPFTRESSPASLTEEHQTPENNNPEPLAEEPEIPESSPASLTEEPQLPENPPAPLAEEPQIPGTSPASLTEPQIPESPQPDFPTPRTALLDKEPVLIAQPETDHDMDTSSPHETTTLTDIPSPELGENENEEVPYTSPLPYSSPSKVVKVIRKPKRSLPTTPLNRKEKRQQVKDVQASKTKTRLSSAKRPQPTDMFSLVSDDEEDEEDELSLTPRPRYYTPPNPSQRFPQPSYTDKTKHTSLTNPLLRMKLLSSSQKPTTKTPKTPSGSLSTNTRVPATATSTASRMYFSADRRGAGAPSSAGALAGALVHSSGGGRIGTMRRKNKGLADEEGEEGEEVQTPGGTRRRCGEGGFRCDRDFCFVCL